MRTNEMLAVMDREAGLLTEDNWHASAAVMADAAERIRKDREIMRRIQRWWLEDGMSKFDGASVELDSPANDCANETPLLRTCGRAGR